jgi:type III pantothenate kinase
VSALVVVDIGNTRIKWGKCQEGKVIQVTAVAADEPLSWQQQFEAWQLGPGDCWVVSGVHPTRRDHFLAWLGQHAVNVLRLESHQDLPLAIALEQPERVGIDRLLNAVAANRRRPASTGAVVIDAGSAVTVDYVDARGAFRGGAIYPGLRLMAQALHDYTALLPLVEVRQVMAPPGTTTTMAIQVGLYYTILGGALQLTQQLRRQDTAAVVFLTGGDAALIAEGFPGPCTLWPEMTLEGILYSSEPSSNR